MYQGSSEEHPEGVTATCYPTYRLTNYRQYKNVGHVLWVDNWFNGPKHLDLCESRNIFSSGTVKSNRVGAGAAQCVISKSGKDIDRGTCKVYQQPDKERYLTTWMDKKGVNLLSSFNLPTTHTCHRQKKSGGREELKRPSMVKEYNANMGGTDLMDQFLQYYRTKVRAKKWPVKVFLHFVHVAVINSHIMYKVSIGENERDEDFHLLQYTKTLFRQLVRDWDKKMFADEQAATVMHPHSRHTNTAEFRADTSSWTGKHTPVLHEVSKNQSGQHRLRSTCVECKLRSTFSCRQCNVPLCLGTINDPKQCWDKYHAPHQL